MSLRLAGRRAAMLAPVLAATLSLAACGNSQTRPLSVDKTYPPGKFMPFGLTRYGIGFFRPANWGVLSNLVRGQVIAIIASGKSVIAVSQYPRTQPPPVGSAALDQARRALLGAIRAKQPTFRLLASTTLTLGGQPAVEVDGVETIDRQRRRVRSTHMFLPGREVVLDEYAPPAIFDQVNGDVFGRVADSLRLLPKTGTTGVT
ncbi:MAG: hypothetical protein ACYDHH_14140 [Solirubrobacteraceae bacterium]